MQGHTNLGGDQLTQLVLVQPFARSHRFTLQPGLNPARAALQGSSALDLGRLWDLATGNIAYHDIHHFNANIPSYRLRQCHKALRARYDVQTIGWPEAIRSFTLKLWDEDQGRLVPFPRHDAQAQVARDV
jgi:omega-6 fatty acid desaturase (delta-12 desaturase)